MDTVNVKIRQNPATPDFFTPYVGWVLALLEVKEGAELPCIIQIPHTNDSPKRMAYTLDEVELTEEPLSWPRQEDAAYEQHGF